MLISASSVYAQGKLNFPRIECFKNITQFTYNPPSGLTLSSATWDFGDGSSSNNSAPQYVYKKTGKFLVTINASFSNGTNSTDTAYITIVPLPIADFRMMGLTDTCFNNNYVCFADSSKPGQSGQNIVNRLVVWGDGLYENQSNPQRGQSFCHKFGLVDKYLVKIEVTDIYGCKASKSRYATILEQSEAGFSIVTPFKDCKTRYICVANTSKGKNRAFAKYTWNISNYGSDTNRYFSAQKCLEYSSSINAKVTLILKDANGCMDSVTLIRNLVVDPLPTKLNLSDTVMCYSSGRYDTASVSNTTYDKLNWLIDGNDISKSNRNYITIIPKANGLQPYNHTITCQIIRGSCTTSLSRKIVVNGPMARMSIYNNGLCFSNRPVTFVDSSKFVDRKKAQYLWHIYDDSAPRCTTDRVKHLNVGGNCIYSTDYFHNHQFKLPPTSYRVSLQVYDPTTGCMDSAVDYYNARICSPLLSFDTFNLCQGEVFGNINDDLNPKFVSFDTGKTWKRFPIRPDSKLSGLIKMGYIYETKIPKWIQRFGDDSIKLRKDTLYEYDTVWGKPYLMIHALNSDTVQFVKYGKCKPFRLSVKFPSGRFNAGQSLNIDWGNNTGVSLYFQRDTLIDSFFYVYNVTSVNAIIKVSVASNQYCQRDTLILFKAGKNISIQSPDDYFCQPSVSCLKFKIIDFYANSLWNSSMLDQYIRIQYPDTPGLASGTANCHFYKSRGYNKFKIMISDQYGCNDTIQDSIFIQDLKATVKEQSKTVYCNELRQFFDSTSMIFYPGEKITYFNWDFGSGTYTNPYQNPFKSIVTSSPEIEAVHVVKTALGCVDTFRFKLRIIGSHPYFRIPDTIACNNLDAVFKNLSQDCKGYIWEFGDPDNNILPITDKSDVRFHYLKAGRYHIKLNGYDSIYNPYTKSKYFCNTVFPDPIFQKDSIRDVIVLPQNQTGIVSLDTVCVGTPVEFRSLSDPFYDRDSWTVDNRYIFKKPQDSIHNTWYQTGQYTVGIWPRFNNPYHDRFCSDSAFKTITVIGQDADFKIDLKSQLPNIHFINTSNPLNAKMLWHFDTTDYAPGSYSTDIHPTHDYGFEFREYDVCLIATSDYGCKDTTCKRFGTDQLVDFKIFNVFTPGVADGKNDSYDILIKGEDKYHLRIYDRWGVLVFESHEDGDGMSENNWNGRYFNKGPECPSGTYYYIFEYTMELNPEQKEMINGTVTLIR